MPNGVDKNLYRLATSVATYRAKFGAWPTNARFNPLTLWDLANILEEESFLRLADLMELRTQKDPPISVGGPPGVVRYGVDESVGAQEDALRWLGLKVRRELQHGH